MNKVLIAIVGSIIAVSVVIIITSNRNNQKISPETKTPVNQKTGQLKKEFALNTYIDPSGFLFQYPQLLTILPVTPLANSYYADIEASASGKPNKAKVIIESTIVKSIADFQKSNSQIPKTAIQTKLADLDAIEYTTNKAHTTQAIDQGTLITITTPITDKEFWDPIHRTVVSTFKFSQPSPSVNNGSFPDGGDGGDDIIFEGEETVE